MNRATYREQNVKRVVLLGKYVKLQRRVNDQRSQNERTINMALLSGSWSRTPGVLDVDRQMQQLDDTHAACARSSPLTLSEPPSTASTDRQQKDSAISKSSLLERSLFVRPAARRLLTRSINQFIS